MKRCIPLLALCILLIACSSSDDGGGGSTGNPDNNKTTGVLSGVPAFDQVTQTLATSDVKFKCENNCQNGVHRYYTAEGSAIDIVNAYRSQLESAGWTIEDTGGGVQGAGLEASSGAKYLDLNAGGQLGGLLNIDLSVWPSEPTDKNCSNCKVTEPDDPTTDPPPVTDPGDQGDETGNLTDDVPTPSGHTFQCENNCGDGIHRYYTSSGNAVSLATNYAALLRAQGWTIVDGPGGVSTGAGLEARKGTIYLDYNAGGQSTSFLNVDLSVWPTEPSNKNCENCEVHTDNQDPGDDTNTDDNAGSTGDLLEDVPHVYSLAPTDTNDCNGGKHLYYQTSASPQTVTPDYQSALEQKGWTVTLSGGGSSYGWGLTATKGAKYLKMNIGGNFFYHVDLCVWPSEPADKECDQDCDN